MNRFSLKDSWDAVMTIERNPMRHLPLTTAHLIMQILAWMWSVIFSLAVGSYFVFGITAVGHSLVIAGIFVTYATFSVARRRAPAR